MSHKTTWKNLAQGNLARRRTYRNNAWKAERMKEARISKKNPKMPCPHTARMKS